MRHKNQALKCVLSILINDFVTFSLLTQCFLSCRKIMDSGELDFYQHSKLCSNTCRSTKIDLVGTRASLSSQASTETTPTPSSADGTIALYTYLSFRRQTYTKNYIIAYFIQFYKYTSHFFSDKARVKKM